MAWTNAPAGPPATTTWMSSGLRAMATGLSSSPGSTSPPRGSMGELGGEPPLHVQWVEGRELLLVLGDVVAGVLGGVADGRAVEHVAVAHPRAVAGPRHRSHHVYLHQADGPPDRGVRPVPGTEDVAR